MQERRATSLVTSKRGVQRLYFHVVQGTVLLVLALQLLMKFVYGMSAVVTIPLLALYGALILLSWYGGSSTTLLDEEDEEARKPWEALFVFITVLVVMLCAETGGVASPYVFLLLATCIFAALILPPNRAVGVTAVASLTYGASSWLYHGAEQGLLTGGWAGLRHAVGQVPRLGPDAASALVVHVAFFWLGTIISSRLSESMRKRVGHAESIALLDPLTGLANRRGFMQKLTMETRRIQQLDWAISMLVIDLDHFKLVNDHFDHKVGDLVLVQTARILRDVAGPLDHVARLGGDEFVIATVGNDRIPAEDLATRIAGAFHKHAWGTVAEGLGRITCSIGISVRTPSLMPGRHVDFDAMLQDADHALLVRKRIGRSGFFTWGDQIPLEARHAPVIPRPPADGPVERLRYVRK